MCSDKKETKLKKQTTLPPDQIISQHILNCIQLFYSTFLKNEFWNVTGFMLGARALM